MSFLKITGIGVLSLMIHGALFVSVDHFSSSYQKRLEEARLLRERESKLQFEFVEAPPKSKPDIPDPQTKRIASRDALTQGKVLDPSKPADILPPTKEVGRSNQLEQLKSEGQSSVSPQKSQKEITPKEKVPDQAGQTSNSESMAMPQKIPASQSSPESKSAPETALMKGLTGQDKITTQEMSRSKSNNAALFGTTSFEAVGSGMGEYMKNLKERIWLQWFPYLAFQYPRDFRGADALLSFTLDKEGNVKIIQVLDDAGDPNFASFCMQAIQKASGFGPLPSEILALIGKDELELKFGFHYR